MSDRIVNAAARRLYARTAYQNGTRIPDIAQSLGVSPITVYAYLREIPKGQKPKVFVTPEVENQIRSMVTCGVSRRTIAAITGLSIYTVSRWTTDMMIRPRHNVETMKGLQSAGYPHQEIAKAMNCSANTVRKYLGKQPEAISNKSRKIAGAVRRFKNQMRKMPPCAFEAVTKGENISA